MIELKIDGMSMTFPISRLNVNMAEGDEYVFVHCPELKSLLDAGINSLEAVEEPPPPPSAPPKRIPVYEPTEKLGKHTIQDYVNQGWEYDALVENGYVTVRYEDVDVPEQPAPAPPEAEAKVPLPPVPEFEQPAPELKATDKCAGASLDKFREAGWTDEMLVDEGYAIIAVNDAPIPPPESVVADFDSDDWPKQIDGEWFDRIGTMFDDQIHGKSDGKPAVKSDGSFKRKRGVSIEKYNERIQLQKNAKVPKHVQEVEAELMPDVVIGDDENVNVDEELQQLMKELGD